MNKLISFGDSFTWGSDLHDAVDGALHKEHNNETYINALHDTVKIGPYDYPDFDHKVTTWTAGYSRNTWPALLAKEKNLDYRCFAEAGCSNQSIVRQFFTYLPNITEKDTVVINWTWIDRWDFHIDNVSVEHQWITIRPSDNDDEYKEYQDIYFKYIHGELWTKYETLKLMLLVQSTLDKLNINYITTTIDPLVFDTNFHTQEYIKTLQHLVKDKFIWFEGLSFYEWAKHNNYKISDKWHPLEEAHEKAFEYINEITK